MRVVVALLASAIVLVLSWIYQSSSEATSVQTSDVVAKSLVSADVTLRLSATFDMGADPFAENLDSAPSLRVLHRGTIVHSTVAPIPAGKTVDIQWQLESETGTEEFFVQATPADLSLVIPRAIRVDLYRGGEDQPLASEIVWGEETDSLVSGTVLFPWNQVGRTQ